MQAGFLWLERSSGVVGNSCGMYRPTHRIPVPIFVCSQCLHRKPCYLPGSGHYLTPHPCHVSAPSADASILSCTNVPLKFTTMLVCLRHSVCTLACTGKPSGCYKSTLDGLSNPRLNWCSAPGALKYSQQEAPATCVHTFGALPYGFSSKAALPLSRWDQHTIRCCSAQHSNLVHTITGPNIGAGSACLCQQYVQGL
jgi:hypothetical protein